MKVNPLLKYTKGFGTLVCIGAIVLLAFSGQWFWLALAGYIIGIRLVRDWHWSRLRNDWRRWSSRPVVIRTTEDRLDELERLKRRDMVTPEEYAAKRQEILKDL